MLKKILKNYIQGEPTRSKTYSKNTRRIIVGVFYSKFTPKILGSIFRVFFSKIEIPKGAGRRPLWGRPGAATLFFT